MTNNQENQKPKNEHAAALGRIRSERKEAARRKNVQQPRPGRRKPLQDFVCNCAKPESLDPNDHKSRCPRGNAIRYRLAHNRPLA